MLGFRFTILFLPKLKKMKYLKNGMTILFMIVGLTNIQAFTSANTAVTQTAEDYYFTVHVGAFVNPVMNDFAKIKPYGFLYATAAEQNLTRIYMGGYPNETTAYQVLDQIKASGYPDAFVTRKKLSSTDQTYSIYLGTEALGRQVDWANYNRGGRLRTLIRGTQMDIYTGDYSTADEANRVLEAVRKIGLVNAKVNQVNRGQLRVLTEFEAGIPLKNIVLAPVEQIVQVQEVLTDRGQPEVKKGPNLMVTKKPAPAPPTNALPPSYDVVIAPRIEADVRPPSKPNGTHETVIPSEFETVVLTEKTGNLTTVAPQRVQAPAIRTKVKRTSVLELQKLLKNEKYYTSSLDGLYGKGTNRGWEMMLGENEIIRKQLGYQECGINYLQPKGVSNILQNYINTLRTNTSVAVKGLETEKAPIAKAYRAYYLLAANGNQMTINQLMNQAIKETFKNKRLQNNPAFDYTATYSYEDMGQLILHLSYLHRATPEVAVPMWLFTEHPGETGAAFKFGTGNYNIAGVDHLYDWEELKLLRQIVQDLCAEQPSAAVLDRAASQRAALLMAPQPLDAQATADVLNWNKTFWSSVETWSKKASILKKWSLPLKASYLQSQIRLEDYYMNKGLSPDQATGYAILTLKTMVAPYLNNL